MRPLRRNITDLSTIVRRTGNRSGTSILIFFSTPIQDGQRETHRTPMRPRDEFVEMQGPSSEPCASCGALEPYSGPHEMG